MDDTVDETLGCPFQIGVHGEALLFMMGVGPGHTESRADRTPFQRPFS
jgi:hypothetical protein